MLKGFRYLVLVAGLVAGPFAATLPASADDAGDIRAVITQQLQAFKTGDSDAAYSFAAPNIRRMFPSPEIFMSMVQSGYAPVFQSSNATFGPLKAEGAGFRQEVHLTDPSGQSYIASYTLERQPDGSLKITSCAIRRGNDLAA
ncbi:DUF4864 domain-containing protein [Aureimonas sp. SA4125]|uniref:DUF4864 domain-containing protein n=1 Tax=Aureimonas sp. SA4125 TaxID=2826993 RepID=UPI001CC65B24|nr:DUF4864 domain-containing protein [Aureimonas sp. SA4125]BDA84541.1 DUF4864 domain-containing protein [Aureimonas sp. SA4125]